jgi:hypothetical protein
MQFSKWSKALAVGAAAAGALAWGSGPAWAAPEWQSWSAPSLYKCGPTTLHSASKNIAMQTCIIRNPNNGQFQSVAVVVNNAPQSVVLSAVVHNSHGKTASCYGMWIPSNTRVACYGETAAASMPDAGNSKITLNNKYEAWTETAVFTTS